MPHIIIEHSGNLGSEEQLKNLAMDLHTTMAQQETIKIEALKTRTCVSHNVVLGTGQKNQLLHITFLLLAGRSDELKQTFINALSETAKPYYDPSVCSFSVEVKELETYYTER